MVYMYHSFLVHSSADGHLGCFHVLAIINSAAMDTGVHVSLSNLVSSVCMPRSGIPGSYDSSSSSFLRNLHTFVVCQKPTRQCEQLITLCCAQSCLTLCDPPGRQPTRLPCPRYSPGKNTGAGCHFILLKQLYSNLKNTLKIFFCNNSFSNYFSSQVIFKTSDHF